MCQATESILEPFIKRRDGKISWEILSKKPDARRKRVMKTTWEEVDAMHQDTDDSGPIWWQWFIIPALGRLR